MSSIIEGGKLGRRRLQELYDRSTSRSDRKGASSLRLGRLFSVTSRQPRADLAFVIQYFRPASKNYSVWVCSLLTQVYSLRLEHILIRLVLIQSSLALRSMKRSCEWSVPLGIRRDWRATFGVGNILEALGRFRAIACYPWGHLREGEAPGESLSHMPEQQPNLATHGESYPAQGGLISHRKAPGKTQNYLI